MTVRVLLVEQDPSEAASLRAQLHAQGSDFDVQWVPTVAEGQALAADADCALLDLTLSGPDGLDVIGGLAAAAPQLPVIALTLHGDEAGGVEAVRRGAQDFLQKDHIDSGELNRAIRYAIERKHSEAQLRSVTSELAERTRQLALSNNTIFDESLTGMLQLDSRGQIIAANDAAASLADIAAEDLTGRSIADLFEPRHGAQLIDAAATVFDEGAPTRRQSLLIRPDGTTRLTAIGLSRLTMDASGEPVVLLTVLDITAGSSAMLRRAHDQKLEEVGRLASGIAHEIRSPLQYVTTSINFARTAVAELLAEEPANRDPELRRELDESLAEVAEGVGRISQIVKGMNILSQRTGNTVEDHDIRDALKFPLAVARGQAPAGTEFVVELGDVPMVGCNIGLIQQVVLNLLVNAIHAIEDAQATRPRTPGRIIVATTYDTESVKLSVSDNGVGMEPDVIARAMEPFFTTKSSGRGTGQGLALARDIMVQHGGRLVIHSELGSGSTITASLPRTDIENKGPTPAAQRR